MGTSGILKQALKIQNVDRKCATHFALYNGDQIRYLIAINDGKKRLSNNISAYSSKLGLLMKLLRYLPFILLKEIRIGCYVRVTLHPEIQKEVNHLNLDKWNVIVGTYDEKQKLVLQCYSHNSPFSTFMKIGNDATEKEMLAEMNFLKNKHSYRFFVIPTILESEEKNMHCPFNIQITKEFVGKKVKPKLTKIIVCIYKEIATQTKIVDGVEYEFSHGDFAPWNIKKSGGKYVVFDWEHCGYRLKGFDLIHYATIVEMVVNRKDASEAFDIGLNEVRKFIPEFDIDKESFILEFKKLRKQLI